MNTLLLLLAFAGGAALAWRRGGRGYAVGLGLAALLPAITLLETGETR